MFFYYHNNLNFFKLEGKKSRLSIFGKNKKAPVDLSDEEDDEEEEEERKPTVAKGNCLFGK